MRVNNEWSLGKLFTIQGKLYWIKDGYIFVLHMDTGRWTKRHHYSNPISCFDSRPDHNGLIPDIVEPGHIWYITSLGDELLLIMGTCHLETFILQSKGFGGKNIDIIWHDSKHCEASYNIEYPANIYPIEL